MLLSQAVYGEDLPTVGGVLVCIAFRITGTRLAKESLVFLMVAHCVFPCVYHPQGRRIACQP